MTYQFDTEHAKKYGVDEAILIQNFAFWIAKNKANNRHEHEDRTWTYNSYKAFAELFEFWSEGQIRTRIESLIDQGVIIKGNFSKNTYDRTTWYAFKDEESFVYQSQKELSESTNGSEQVNNSSTSTDNKPYSKPDNYDYSGWVDFWNDTNDAKCRVTDKKRKQIRQRLKTYSEEEIKTAIRNRSKDDWINGDGLKHKTNWSTFWRNDEKPERYLNKTRNETERPKQLIV